MQVLVQVLMQVSIFGICLSIYKPPIKSTVLNSIIAKLYICNNKNEGNNGGKDKCENKVNGSVKSRLRAKMVEGRDKEVQCKCGPVKGGVLTQVSTPLLSPSA